KYLASKPPKDAAELAEQASSTCKEQIAKAKRAEQNNAEAAKDTSPPPDIEKITNDGPDFGSKPGAAPMAPATTAGPPAVQEPEAPKKKGWYNKDPLGEISIVVGTGAVVVGAILYNGARGKIDDAEKQLTYGDSQALVDSAKSARLYSIILVGVGAGAL